MELITYNTLISSVLIKTLLITTKSKESLYFCKVINKFMTEIILRFPVQQILKLQRLAYFLLCNNGGKINK